MVGNKWWILLLFTSSITAIDAMQRTLKSKSRRSDSIAGHLPSDQELADLLAKKPLTQLPTITLSNPVTKDYLQIKQKIRPQKTVHDLSITVKEMQLTSQPKSVDRSRSTTNGSVDTEIEPFRKTSREDLLTARNYSSSQLPPLDQSHHLHTTAAEITDNQIIEFIQASDITALEEYAYQVAHISATVRGRFKTEKPAIIDQVPYFGAIIIAIQNHATEALSYLVSKAGSLNIPLEAEYGKKYLCHYIVQAMAIDSILDKAKAEEMLTILHRDGSCDLEAVDGYSGESPIQIAATLPYSAPVMGYLQRHTKNPRFLHAALDAALKCSATDSTVEDLLKHPDCSYIAFMHLIANQHRYQHIETIIDRNPNILDDICRISLSSEYSLPLSAAIEGDWFIIAYLLSRKHLTPSDLLTFDTDSNIFLSAYNEYVDVLNSKTYASKDFFKQEKRAAFMRKCLELLPIEAWMEKSGPDHLLIIRESMIAINQISSQHTEEATRALEYINCVV